MRQRLFLLTLFCFSLVIGCGGDEPAEEPEAAASPTPLPINNEFAYYQSIETDGSYRLIGKSPVKAETFQYAKCYHFVYDDAKKLIAIEYLHKGQPAVDSLFQAHRVTIDYSDNRETRAFFDLEGKPTAGASGVFAYRLTYDGQGHLVELLNLDRDQHPLADSKDIVQSVWKYDASDNLIESRYLDGDGRLRLSGPDHLAVLRYRYDSQGRVIEKSGLGLDEKPTPNAEGVAIVRFQYNEMDNLVEIANFDPADQPVESLAGVARTTFHYTEKGQYQRTESFSKDGKPIGVAGADSN